ncbi:hypothetical protein ACFE04_026981 [Oxalis oulophora]
MGIESDGFGAVGDGFGAKGGESDDGCAVGGESDGHDVVDGGDTISISREDPILSGEGATIDGDGATIDADAKEFDEYEETEESGTDDEEDHNSGDGVSLCSDRVDEELVSLMKDAKNITDTAATHGPETVAIRQNRRESNRNNSDDEYDVGTNYMEDPNLNWSFKTDEEFVPEDSDGEEVNDIEVGVDDMRIPHIGERLRVDSVTRNNKRLEHAEKWKTDITPRILDIFDDYSEESRKCMVLFGVKNGWEVQEGKDTCIVRITEEECSCRVWDLQGIPSRHAIPILQRKGENPEIPPPPRKKLGRPRKKRILESGAGGKMRCKLCKVLGHDKRKCPLKGEGKEAELAAAQAAYVVELAPEKAA